MRKRAKNHLTNFFSFCFLYLFILVFVSCFCRRRSFRIIVGIDAGTTSAFAVLDYSGNLVALKSRRNWGSSDFVSEISSYCTPAVIACDTNPASKMAYKLKSCFSSKLFQPKHSLSIVEKHQVAEKLTSGRKWHMNSHERDALAAAYKAYSHYSNKLRQTVAAANRSSASPTEACARVIAGECMSSAIRS